MKISRGRLSQYNLLLTEKKLNNYLVETALFSKASLYTFLEKYHEVVVKPTFGIGELIISFENKGYKIRTDKSVLIIIDREEMYQHLIHNELKQKFYIILPQKLTSKKLYQYFLTVHRKSLIAKWRFTSNTSFEYTFFGDFHKHIYFYKMKRISLLAAHTLGEHFDECHTIVIKIICDVTGNVWIEDTILHLPISKWDQYQVLTNNRALISFVPKTDLLTKMTLTNYLTKYREVIIKPHLGQHGKGIVQIRNENSTTYEIRYGIRTIKKRTLEETYQFIQENFLINKDYLVQQRIPLALINDCPIDVRVITQKIDSNWKVTGKLVKVAGKDFFVTNAAQKLLTLENAWKELAGSRINIKTLEKDIEEICLLASNQLEKGDKSIDIIGFDIGLTEQGDIWIIEGNYVPDLTMFNKGEFEQMYKDIGNAKKR